MLYCDLCADEGFSIPIPKTIFKRKGPCELCKAEEDCNGIPSKEVIGWPAQGKGTRWMRALVNL